MTLFDTTTPVTDPLVDGQTGPAGTTEQRAAAVTPGAAASTTPAGPIVIGVDLSLTRTGVASRHRAVSITSSGKRDDTLAQRQQRLRHLRGRIIIAIADAGDPDLIVIEGPSYGSKNAGSQHDRSGLWWLLIDVFTIRGWHVLEVAPSTRMKWATGRGNAGKDEVLAAAMKRLPFEVTNNDEADAAWLCAIGHELLGDPLTDVPATHRAALDSVRPRLHDLTGVR